MVRVCIKVEYGEEARPTTLSVKAESIQRALEVAA